MKFDSHNVFLRADQDRPINYWQMGWMVCSMYNYLAGSSKNHFNFWPILTIFLSVGHKNRCQMFKRPFMVFHHSRNIPWLPTYHVLQNKVNIKMDCYDSATVCRLLSFLIVLSLIFHYLGISFLDRQRTIRITI